MIPFFVDNFSNAHSTHKVGLGANKAVNTARQQVAELIGAETSEIVFTSRTTESINLAIKASAENYQSKGNHIITMQTEHAAVMEIDDVIKSAGALFVTMGLLAQ